MKEISKIVRQNSGTSAFSYIGYGADLQKEFHQYLDRTNYCMKAELAYQLFNQKNGKNSQFNIDQEVQCGKDLTKEDLQIMSWKLAALGANAETVKNIPLNDETKDDLCFYLSRIESVYFDIRLRAVIGFAFNHPDWKDTLKEYKNACDHGLFYEQQLIALPQPQRFEEIEHYLGLKYDDVAE